MARHCAYNFACIKFIVALKPPAMTLSDYLDRHGMKRIDFAKAIDVTPGYITSLCNGASWPSRAVMAKIRKATRGAVTPNDFLPEKAKAS